ncbi:MAG: hypothetical protein QOC67_4276, partial [Pseudonocardiales bacterium]|nr:hypothetical protein [Pseudonocardiales bacterium]
MTTDAPPRTGAAPVAQRLRL